jgi:hypothetical protein
MLILQTVCLIFFLRWSHPLFYHDFRFSNSVETKVCSCIHSKEGRCHRGAADNECNIILYVIRCSCSHIISSGGLHQRCFILIGFELFEKVGFVVVRLSLEAGLLLWILQRDQIMGLALSAIFNSGRIASCSIKGFGCVILTKCGIYFF